jgi:serine/threonine protein kinase
MWSDLESVLEHHSTDVESKDHWLAEFKFRSGGQVVLDLSSMSEGDQMTFVSTIDELAANCNISPALWALKGASQTGNSESRRLSYTRFWEESLAASLRSTVFVPLSGGDCLQDGRIRIVRQLASTPWSATYLGRLDERQLVVVKESVEPGLSASSAKAMELFERECRVLTTLNHSKIARVCDHFVEKGRRYLILEYFAGLDLRELLLRKGAFAEDIVIRIGVEVCSALSYLHNHNPVVIHRDVTPDNIVMGDDGDVRLIDFGASKFFSANATGTLVGKQSFIAPEQLRGMPDTLSDIYALGATMYALLTGEDPVPLGQCMPVGRNRPISAALAELISEMTSFEADRRPPTVQAVQGRLQLLQIPGYRKAGAASRQPVAAVHRSGDRS